LIHPDAKRYESMPTAPKGRYKRVTINFPLAEWSELEQASRVSGISVSDIVRLGTGEILKRPGFPPRIFPGTGEGDERHAGRRARMGGLCQDGGALP
jgi:hypothetical protein